MSASFLPSRWGKSVFSGLCLTLVLALFLSDASRAESFAEQAKSAALDYADEQARGYIAEQSEAAIKALVKRLKSATKNEALLEKLEATALGAEEIKDLAEKFGSGDRDQIEEAGQSLALTMGGWLRDLIEDPDAKESMTGLLDSADKMNEIVEVLGATAGGDATAALEFVGNAIIEMTPAAGVIGVYQGAYSAMEYVHDTYVEYEMESLYKEFRENGMTEAQLRERLDLPPYSYVIRDMIIEKRQERMDELGDAIGYLPDSIRDRLVSPSDEEIASEIASAFASRVEKERADAEAQAEARRAEKNAAIMFEWLDWYAKEKFGENWSNSRTYDLSRFARIVRTALKEDDVLDPQDPIDVRLMASVKAAQLTFGRDSEEYRDALRKLEERRTFLGGDTARDWGQFDGLYVGTQTSENGDYPVPVTIRIAWPKMHFTLDHPDGVQSWTYGLKADGDMAVIADYGDRKLQCGEIPMNGISLQVRCRFWLDWTVLFGEDAGGEWVTLNYRATRQRREP